VLAVRVVCNSIDEFIRNLDEPGANLFQNAVRLSTDLQHLNGRNKREATVFKVEFQATTVVQQGDAEYLLVFVEDCGMDHRDAQEDDEGTERAEELREALNKVCVEKGFELKPGFIEI